MYQGFLKIVILGNNFQNPFTNAYDFVNEFVKVYPEISVLRKS